MASRARVARIASGEWIDKLMPTAIVKYMPPQPYDAARDYIARMWELFLHCNAASAPDASGAYMIADDIGEVREKNWERMTPYSLAKT